MTTERHPLDGATLAFSIVDLECGNRVAECVGTAGDVTYWFLRPLCPEHEARAVHGNVDGAMHERRGPLPESYQDRVQSVPFRCCRLRSGGHRCRTRVAEPGVACSRHLADEMTAESTTGSSTAD